LRATTDAPPLGRPIVACGSASFGTRVVIADPETRRPCRDGEIGEIWVASPSVAQGYWRRDALTAETFCAYLDDDQFRGPFLRTGDLGAMQAGELIVTGRLKDVLIVRGLKHYPQDLELTAERQHAALRPGCAAAFQLDGTHGDGVAIAIEVDPRELKTESHQRAHQLCDAISAIRRAITEEHGIVIDAVALLSIGTMPKTSSGKIRRHACKLAFAAGTLDEILRWPEAGNAMKDTEDVLLEESAA
jgi:acyl-CoA synthetase (AMP-forming)/AMP-acid ligase II